MSRSILVLVFLAAFAATAFGDTLNVPRDYDTIQGAVDVAKSGDVIKVKRGTYTESVAIGLIENVTLKAAGKVILDGEGVRDPLRIGLASNVQIIGITIVNSVGPGIFLAGTESVLIAKCRIEDSGTHGIEATSCRNLRVDRCRFENTEQYGFHLEDESEGPSSMDCIVNRCRFRETGDTAINFSGGTGHLVQKNRIVDSGADGIYVIAGDVTVLKNRIKGASEGIVIYADGATVEKNRVKDCTSFGIYLFGDDCTALKNRVKGSWNAAFRVRGEDNLLEKNRMLACLSPLRLDEGGNDIIGNRARKCDEGVEDHDPLNNTYEKNNFERPIVLPR